MRPQNLEVNEVKDWGLTSELMKPEINTNRGKKSSRMNNITEQSLRKRVHVVPCLKGDNRTE